jgi:hypothetical protein
VLLLIGGVIGAQIGTQIGLRLKAEQLRILLGADGACGLRQAGARSPDHAAPSFIRSARRGGLT